MHMTRGFVIALGAVAAWACAHDDPATVISRDGAEQVAIVDLTTGGSGNFPGGTRTTNRFLATAFDTSIADAFARASTNPPFFRPDPNCGYGSTPLIYAAGTSATPTYTTPNRYLPALVGGHTILDVSGCGTAVDYIVQPGHPGNGGTVWEFWYEFDGAASKRYISGLARYALLQRGALDQAELLLNGTVTTPDSLVFMPGDSNPGGKKARARFTTNCASLNLQHAVAGLNPIWLGSDTTGRIAPLQVSIDATVSACAGEPWGNLGTATSPVPTNNNAASLTVGGVTYNFYVIWEALADSTPDYTKPIYRQQIGPLITTTGAVVNNSYGPVPTAALSAAAKALLPGATAAPDTIRVTANNLVPLTGATYQMWLAQTGTANAAKVTGRVIRLNGATVVDTLSGVSEFNVTASMTGARVEFDFATFTTTPWDAAVLAVGASGAGTLPAAQPLWTTMVTQKVPGGAIPSLSSNLTFGSFNGGTGAVPFAAAGSGTGGVFGLEVREDIKRLRRPPVGYLYEAWLLNSSDPTVQLPLGTLREPYPDQNTLLTDADVMTTLPLSGAELTRAAALYIAGDYGAYCEIASISGTPPDTTISAKYNQLQVRLRPKSSAANLPPTVVLTGSMALPPGATTHKSECTP